ncbi:pseudouridine synthase [Paucilactobacillus sp. N302-9]
MERLQKIMAEAGVASRRASEKLIESGHVKVNGEVITQLGTKVSRTDEIEVDGVPLEKQRLEYYLLNKPRGVISSAHDEKGRKTVVDVLAPEVTTRVYPVGRLDYDTTGALLLTNDGELANQMTHPKFEVEKSYIAKIKGIPNNDELKQLRLGVMIDGHKTKPAKTKLLEVDRQKKTAIVRIVIHEGRNHQVKNMFQKIGHDVLKLHRESDGILNVQGLQPGKWRRLKQEEIKRLKD